jgi:hypothetical protein
MNICIIAIKVFGVLIELHLRAAVLIELHFQAAVLIELHFLIECGGKGGRGSWGGIFDAGQLGRPRMDTKMGLIRKSTGGEGSTANAPSSPCPLSRIRSRVDSRR